MEIGHIDYLNLLPFYQFLKKKGIKVKKSYPAKVNEWFEKGYVKAAFISSVKAKNKRCYPVGIAARGRVRTVLVCPGEGYDSESATSNVLAEILKVNGRVVIGDKAFKEKKCKDLAEIWFEKYGLPFVFALFCANADFKKYEKLIYEFIKSRQKIPYKILKTYAEKAGISYKEAKDYLDNVIYYDLGWREKKALKKFWYLTDKGKR